MGQGKRCVNQESDGKERIEDSRGMFREVRTHINSACTVVEP